MGLLKRKPGEKPLAEEWAEHKKEEMDLEEPILPEWRAGRLSIGYHEERDLLFLEAEEVLPEEEETEGAETPADREPSRASHPSKED